MFKDLSALDWYILPDSENAGVSEKWFESVPENAVACRIPSMIQQYFPNRHGVFYYWCRLDRTPVSDENSRVFLHFDGVDYKADVWLDGSFLGSHEGGEAPFGFDISRFTEASKPHLLCVRVVNPTDTDIDGLNLRNIPCRNKVLGHGAGSGFNCGGIWYGAQLIKLPKIHIEDMKLSGDIHSGVLNAVMYIASPCEGSAEITLRVFERCGIAALAGQSTQTVYLARGINEVGLSLPVADVKLWSPDSPNLYRVEPEVKSVFGVHSVTRAFGFREMKIVDGFFTLNGRRFFLKCSHTGNNFPVGMMLPADPELLRRDLIFAKDSGFNMIRSIAGVLRPEQLDICDEIGLMVYEECYAAWNVGQGCGAPIGDEDRMLWRYRTCTLDMIRRDKNHPCITVWGLLNESPDNSVFREAVKLLPEVVKADGTRVVMLNAGRFDNCLSVGSCANPGVSVWQNLMGIDGTDTRGQTWSSPDTIGGSLYNAGDYHMYPTVPMSERYINDVRSLGEGANPVFYSETGIGSLFDVIEEMRMFEQRGERRDLEDYAWLRQQSEDFSRDFRAFGLESVFPFPEALLTESRRVHSAERTEIFNLIRANPRINGYSLTGFLDHGMCGEGLISLWRRPKPGIYDALCDGWSSLRFCLFSKRNMFAGRRFAFEAVLANENALPAGRYTADFALVNGDNLTLWRTSADFEIPENAPFAVPLVNTQTDITLSAGEYKLCAELRGGGAPTGGTRRFTVTAVKEKLNIQKLFVLGADGALSDFAAAHGLELIEWKGEPGAVAVGADLSGDDIALLHKAMTAGARVLFLSPKPFIAHPEYLDELGLADIRPETGIPDWLYHKECVVTPHKAFEGFKKGLASFPVFGYSFPDMMFKCKNVPDEVISPAFHTGCYAIEGSYGAFHVLLGLNIGKGKAIFNCYRVLDTLETEPAAVKVLENLLESIAE